jgi:hypothetical protein
LNTFSTQSSRRAKLHDGQTQQPGHLQCCSEGNGKQGHCTNANNHNDSETKDKIAVQPRPTHSKALEAISTIQSYVEDIDTSYAHTVKDVLAIFGWQTQVEGMKSARETKIYI